MDTTRGFPGDARQVGQRAALRCAAIGLVLAAAASGLMGLGATFAGGRALLLCLGILASVLGLAATLGGPAGVRIRQGGSPKLLGVALALATLLLSTLGVSLLVWLDSNPTLGTQALLGDLTAYVLKPLCWVALAGTLPACALGLYYARLVLRAQDQLGAQG